MPNQPAELMIHQSQSVMPAQARDDTHLIDMWLHGRSPATARAYSADAQAFLAFVAKPLAQVTVGDVQQFGSSLGHLATASQARSLSSVKSLLAFAHRLGYVPFNVGAVVRLPKIKNTLAERIMDEADVHRMLALETDARNAALLRLVYAAGLRVSEACSLRWRDLAANKEAGQANVFGKGGKTRTILLPASVWRGLQALRNDASPDAPLFPSRKGGSIGEVQAWRIVKAAAARAGLSRDVSTHWLRHAHASHALDRGAPIALVQATLGHANLATTGRYTHARPSESSSKYLAL